MRGLKALIGESLAQKKGGRFVILIAALGRATISRVLIADYQKDRREAAFKRRAADLILGHHAHVPKAIEVIDGKVCFHSLGNVSFSTDAKNAEPLLNFRALMSP